MKRVINSFILASVLVYAEPFFCVNFDHLENKVIQTDMEYAHILGERCSGTNYIYNLIKQNIPGFRFFHQENDQLYAPHKHFVPWVIGDCEKFESLLLKYQTNKVLYIVVIRNIYDWLRSFFLQPHHVHPSKIKDFGLFLKTPYKSKDFRGKYDDKNFIKNFPFILRNAAKEKSNVYDIWNKFISIIDNTDPLTSEPFKNIIALRQRKYENYLAFKDRVKNIIFIRYEDVNNQPEEFLAFISKISKQQRLDYIPCSNWKLTKTPYTPKAYFDFTKEQLDFINTNTDWSLEEYFGYNKKL